MLPFYLLQTTMKSCVKKTRGNGCILVLNRVQVIESWTTRTKWRSIYEQKESIFNQRPVKLVNVGKSSIWFFFSSFCQWFVCCLCEMITVKAIRVMPFLHRIYIWHIAMRHEWGCSLSDSMWPFAYIYAECSHHKSAARLQQCYH